VVIAVGFRSPIATKSLRPKISVEKFYISVNIDIPRHFEDACHRLVGRQCPIKAHDDVLYTMVMKLDDYTPSLNVAMEMVFVGDNNRPVSCFEIDIHIH
jgi:hypothetical protein